MEQDKSMYGNLQDDFLNDLRETQRVILTVGQKGSGKTTLFNSYLKYSLINKMYDTYHLVIPSYKYEMSGSYEFLQNQYQCFIYPTYTAQVSNRVLNDRKKGNKILFMIDDASGFTMTDEHIKHLVTTSRHGKSKNYESGGVCIFLCVHSARRVLLPIFRNNCDYVFIYQMNNKKLLESLYEEYFGMVYDKFVDFLNVYKNAMKEKYNAILYSNQHAIIDDNVKSWTLISQMMDVKELKQTGKKPQTKKSDKKENETIKSTTQSKISEMFKPIQFNKGIRFNH